MADRRNDDSDDYREREIKTAHIYDDDCGQDAGEEEEGGREEEEYEEEGPDLDMEGGISLDKVKETIMGLQIALKRKDIELLQARQQNIQLLHELEKLSEQYIKDQSREADQLTRVKQYEEEFQQIQRGSLTLNQQCKKSLPWLATFTPKYRS